MSIDATKKPPTTTTSEPHELEHQIRLRAYELYEARGRKDATSWKTGSTRKKESR